MNRLYCDHMMLAISGSNLGPIALCQLLGFSNSRYSVVGVGYDGCIRVLVG